jgi:hypothetical protein
MLLLTSTSDVLQIVTDAAASVDVHASWLDNAAGTVTPGRTNTAIATAATTTVVDSPGASTQRNVQTLIVRNKSAATSSAVTVRHSDGSTIVELFKVTLYPAQELTYIDGQGWEIFDSRGNQLVSQQLSGYPVFYDAQRDFGFVGDLVTTFDGACNSAAPTKITSATAAFVATDVGKRITLAGAGAAGAQYTGTISAVDSGTQVTVSPNITTTVTTKGMSFGTDNSAAITLMVNTINGLTFPGASIFFGRSATNSYGFPSRVVFNKTCQIQGIGGGHNTDSGDYTRIGGTRLAWWGTDSDSGVGYSAFFEFSATGAQALKRVAMRSCWLDCRNGDQNEALFGLRLMSCHGFMLEDFFIMDPLAAGLITNVSSTPSEAKDTTRFGIRDFCVRVLDLPQAGAMTTPILMTSAVTMTTTPQSLTVAANTLPTAGYCWVASHLGYPILVKYTGGGSTVTLTGCVVSADEAVNAPATVNGSNVVQACPGNAAAMILDGGTTANTCCGTIQMIQLSHGTTWGPAAIEIRNSDSIQWQQPVVNGGNATNDGAINRIRKPGVRICGSNSSDTLAARNHVFKGGDAGAGGVFVAAVLNTAARMSAMPGPNYWSLYEMGNGAPVPVVEGNAFFDWQPNGGFGYGQRGSSSIADQAVAAATLTLLTGSLIQVPPQGFQVGAKFRWKFRGSKTAAGTAVRNFFIKIGTAGTTGDATVATFLSTGAVTAAVDVGDWEVEFTIRGPLGATCAGVAHLVMQHQLAATGLSANNPEINVGTMATWNSTTAKQFISLCLTTGVAEAITIQTMGVECINPANP